MIQVNWVTDARVVRREGMRHQVSRIHEASVRAQLRDGRCPCKLRPFATARRSGNSLYKALTHPLAAERAGDLLEALAAAGPVAIYDPDGIIAAFDAFYPLRDVEVAGLYVQNVAHLGGAFRGHAARPVTALADSQARAVFVASFEEAKAARSIGHLVPAGAQILSFESLKLPASLLSDKRRYLNTLNFATNYVFFRDADGHHTRLVSANYWTRYGAKAVQVWCRLFDGAGKALASWTIDCPDPEGSLIIDSAEVRARFGLRRLYRPALRACGRRGRTRHRQIRARHLWRWRRRAVANP